jgi:hypothetical protein
MAAHAVAAAPSPGMPETHRPGSARRMAPRPRIPLVWGFLQRRTGRGRGSGGWSNDFVFQGASVKAISTCRGSYHARISLGTGDRQPTARRSVLHIRFRLFFERNLVRSLDIEQSISLDSIGLMSPGTGTETIINRSVGRISDKFHPVDCPYLPETIRQL